MDLGFGPPAVGDRIHRLFFCGTDREDGGDGVEGGNDSVPRGDRR
jgi:hypothetical protein